MPTRPSPTSMPSRLPDLDVLKAAVARRSLLRGAGVVGAVGALAACGGDDAGSGDGEAAGTVTLGSNRGDEVPRAAEDAMIAAFDGGSGITVETERPGQRDVPGVDQLLPAGQPGGRLHVVRRLPGALLRRPGVHRQHLRRLGRDRGRLHRRASRRPRPTGTSRSSCRSCTTTRGRSSTARACSRRTATRSRRPSEELIALAEQMQADGIIPDRPRRRRRLAGHGHVRHPQHAPERLRVPHRPDGRQPGLGHRRGPRGLRAVGRAAAVPPGRPGRAHLAGRRRLAPAEGVGHVHARHVRRGAVPGGRGTGRPRLLQLPGRWSRRSARRHRRPDRRLHDDGGPRERGGRQGAPHVHRLGRGAADLRRDEPEQHRGPLRRGHQRVHARCS